MRIGDFNLPWPCVTMGAYEIVPGLYSLRAVSIMGPKINTTHGAVSPMVTVDSCPDGVISWSSQSEEMNITVNANPSDFYNFAKKYGGVCHKQKISGQTKYLVKGIARLLVKEWGAN